MFRKVTPLDGSKIKIEESISELKLFWSNDSPIGKGWFVIIFLCCWLCGWFMGETSTLNQLLHPKNQGAPQYFLLFWIAGWTLGGLWCMVTIYFYLRPTKPSELIVDSSYLTYTTGIIKPKLSFSRKQSNQFRNMFPTIRNNTIKMQLKEVSNVKIERIESELRLTVDHKTKRIEIGATLSEPEKEWLHSELRKILQL